LHHAHQTLEQNHDVAYLLLGTIALDTVNLDVKAKRTTEKDLKAVASLEKILGISDEERV
jgi:inorganic pyrophosphatase/exopolyphosphatase